MPTLPDVLVLGPSNALLAEPGVSGTVTLDVEDEPWDHVLQRIVDQCGATFSRKDGRIVVRARAPEPEAGPTPHGPDAPGTDPLAEPPRPRRLRGPAPEYPEEAIEAGAEGAVVLRCRIGTDGKVHDIEVLRPVPHGLTEAAVAAVRKWEFEPVVRDGKPVPVTMNIVVRFTLDGGDTAKQDGPARGGGPHSSLGAPEEREGL